MRIRELGVDIECAACRLMVPSVRRELPVFAVWQTTGEEPAYGWIPGLSEPATHGCVPVQTDSTGKASSEIIPMAFLVVDPSGKVVARSLSLEGAEAAHKLLGPSTRVVAETPGYEREISRGGQTSEEVGDRKVR